MTYTGFDSLNELGKPVSVEFDHEGNIVSKITYPDTEQYQKYSKNDLMGANAWDSDSEPNEPKPKSNQDRLKDEFGDKAE